MKTRVCVIIIIIVASIISTGCFEINMEPANDVAVVRGTNVSFSCKALISSTSGTQDSIDIYWWVNGLHYDVNSSEVTSGIDGNYLYSNISLHTKYSNVGYLMEVLCILRQNGKDVADAENTLTAQDYPCRMEVECVNIFHGRFSALHCRWKPTNANCSCKDCMYMASIEYDNDNDRKRRICQLNFAVDAYCDIHFKSEFIQPDVNFVLTVMNEIGTRNSTHQIKPQAIGGSLPGLYHISSDVAGTNENAYIRIKMEITKLLSLVCPYVIKVQYKELKSEENLEKLNLEYSKFSKVYWETWKNYTHVVDPTAASWQDSKTKYNCDKNGNGSSCEDTRWVAFIDGLPGNTKFMLRAKYEKLNISFSHFKCGSSPFYSEAVIVTAATLPPMPVSQITMFQIKDADLRIFINCSNDMNKTDTALLWNDDDPALNNKAHYKIVAKNTKKNNTSVLISKKNCIFLSEDLSESRNLEINVSSINEVSDVTSQRWLTKTEAACQLILLSLETTEIVNNFISVAVKWTVSKQCKKCHRNMDLCAKNMTLMISFHELTAKARLWFENRNASGNYHASKTTNFKISISQIREAHHATQIRGIELRSNQTINASIFPQKPYRVGASLLQASGKTIDFHSSLLANFIVYQSPTGRPGLVSNLHVTYETNEVEVNWQRSVYENSYFPVDGYKIYYSQRRPCIHISSINLPSCKEQLEQGQHNCKDFKPQDMAINVPDDGFVSNGLSDGKEIGLFTIKPTTIFTRRISFDNQENISQDMYVWVSAVNERGEGKCASTKVVTIQHSFSRLSIFLLVVFVALAVVITLFVKFRKIYTKMNIPKPVILAKVKPRKEQKTDLNKQEIVDDLTFLEYKNIYDDSLKKKFEKLHKKELNKYGIFNSMSNLNYVYTSAERSFLLTDGEQKSDNESQEEKALSKDTQEYV